MKNKGKTVKQAPKKRYWHFLHQGRLVSVRSSNKVDAVRQFRRLVLEWAPIIVDVHSSISMNWLNGHLRILKDQNPCITVCWNISCTRYGMKQCEVIDADLKLNKYTL